MTYAIAFLVGLVLAALIVRLAWRHDRHERVRAHMRDVCADVDRTRAPWLRMEQPGAVAERLHGKRSGDAA